MKQLLTLGRALIIGALLLISTTASAASGIIATKGTPQPGIAAVDTLEIVQSRYIASPAKVSVVHPELKPGETYPVVYLLNGYGGNYRDYVNNSPRVKQLADQFGMILVCPDGRNSWYWDSPTDSTLQMESYITKELVPLIDSLYPTKADPKHRAITGLSMGGHGAMWLGIRHPDLFGSICSMSGGLNIEPFAERWTIAQRIGPYQGNEQLWRDHTVINLVNQIQPGQNIAFDCGIDDFFAGVNQQMHQALVEANVPHDYTSRPGKHTWDYWRNAILYHLTYFNEIFNR